MRTDGSPAEQPASSPLSLARLREAFAAMLGPQEKQAATQTSSGTELAENTGLQSQTPNSCEINPRSVVEAILFLGHPENRPITSRELAAAMRGVSPTEVDAAIHELNRQYDKDQSPYRIEVANTGCRLVLRKEFERMRDKFQGRMREAKLSPAALEVLSIVAYNQPVAADQINQLRGAPNGAALSALVRHRLVRLDRPAEEHAKPCYTTTERFLTLFGLESIESLPRSEELEKI
jgi:segregation and condensation protein B